MSLRSIQVIQTMYGLFLAISLYFLFLADYTAAGTNLLIGLIFDPFDQSIPFNQRARWQQAWLVTHTLLGIGLVLFGLLRNW